MASRFGFWALGVPRCETPDPGPLSWFDLVVAAPTALAAAGVGLRQERVLAVPNVIEILDGLVIRLLDFVRDRAGVFPQLELSDRADHGVVPVRADVVAAGPVVHH